MNTTLSVVINQVLKETPSAERVDVLNPLVDYIVSRLSNNEQVNLNFICTHNSRRSQFSQLWAKTAAGYYGTQVNALSGGVEVTAFNERAIASIGRFGWNSFINWCGCGRFNCFYCTLHAGWV